jgi:integrase
VFRTKADADAWLASQQVDRARGSWIDPREGRRTFDHWAATWLCTTVHLKAKTRVGYESILRTHLMPAFGGRQVIRIDQPAVKAFLAEMAASGAAPGTIRSARQVLRLVLATAVGAKALASNPCDGVKLPKSAKAEMHFLTEDQVEDLALAITLPSIRPAGQGAAPHWRTELPEYGLLVRFAAYTGLRAGELGALRVCRIDLLRRRIEVNEAMTEVNGRLVLGPTKTYESRSVPLPRFLCDELVSLLARKGREDFVFPGPEGGPRRHGNFYAHHFKPAVRQAGLPDTVRFHDLRHSFAGFLIAEGAHPRAIMERMGHSSITVTLNTYGHILPGLEEHLTEALDTRARGAPATAGSGGSRVGHAGVATFRPHLAK